MQNAFSTLLGPILVLWLGALVFYALDRFLEPQDAGVAEAVVLTLATGTLVLGRAQVDTTFRFGRALVNTGWPGRAPFLCLDNPSWIMSLILLVAATAASLASWGGRVRGRAGRMAVLGATLFLFSAGDWATLALIWVLIDVFLLYAEEEGASEAEAGGRPAERRRRVACMSLGGAVLLGLAVTLGQLSGLPADRLSWPAAGLAMMAALFRLLPWPLPSWYADSSSSSGASPEDTDESDDKALERHPPLARVVSYLAPTLSSVYLWSRLGTAVQGAEGERWLSALALWAGAALLVSALRAWNAQEPRQLIELAAPYGAAMTLLFASLGLPAQWQLLAGAGAVLNVCALYVGWTQCQYLDIADPRSYWRVAPTGLALLSLAGMPLTIGFPTRAAIYSQVFADGRWFVLLLVLVGETGMLGALLRVLLDVECRELPDERDLAFGARSAAVQRGLQTLVYAGGAALALGTIVLGIAPGLLGAQGLFFWLALPKMHVWAALLLPTIGAIALYRSQDNLLAWMDEWWPLLRRTLGVQWAFQAVERAARLIRTIVWSASRVIDGAGYMAWVLLVCLVLLLFFPMR